VEEVIGTVAGLSCMDFVLASSVIWVLAAILALPDAVSRWRGSACPSPGASVYRKRNRD